MIHRHRMIFDNPEEEIHTGILLPLLCFIIIIAITDGALGKSKAYSLHIVLLVAQKLYLHLGSYNCHPRHINGTTG